MSELRKISKIARNVSLYKNSLGTNQMSANAYEALRLIVKHPGSNSLFLVTRMSVDKALISRIVAQLKKDEYITIQDDPNDKRAKKLFPTSKATALKLLNESEDEVFYDFLEKNIPEDQKIVFYKVLDSLYEESKNLRHHNFAELKPEHERNKD
ncbi:MAG: MarR family transcriptional regulator [Bacilli bacterium]|nr:MarR family transcriptional regulator [Bacilli bacterium]